MSDLRLTRYQSLLRLRQLAEPARPAAAAHPMGRGHLRRREDPETGEITGWAQALTRGGTHCLTCGRRLVSSGGSGLTCPDHGRLLAITARPLRRNETVSITAVAGRRFRLVTRTSDGRRYRVAARHLRPLIMDGWQWHLP